jgi:putative flippase GtrA
MRLAASYILFAMIATAMNLGAQYVAGKFSPAVLEPWLSMMVGTGSGLVVKYVLDKQFIFRADHLQQSSQLARSFFLYALTGGFMTVLFWGAELGFLHAYPAWAAARYVGGGLGLAIGYALKYQLDRRYAFA